jgi:hypothetical protein
MYTKIDRAGTNFMLDILCGTFRKIFRYYYIYKMDKDTIMLELGIDEKQLSKILRILQHQIRQNLIYKKCEKCGKFYYTSKECSTICEKCQSNDNQNYELSQTGKPKNRKKRAVKSISEILRDMEKYNKEHNTNLSYGYYVFISGE